MKDFSEIWREANVQRIREVAVPMSLIVAIAAVMLIVVIWRP